MSRKKPSRVKKQAPAAKPKEPQPVPRHEQQFALIGDTLLDIEAACRILRAAPRRFVYIDVDSWARLYGLDGNPLSPIFSELVPPSDLLIDPIANQGRS